MSERISSTRDLGETIVTQALPRHEDLTQILSGDIVKWDGFAYIGGSTDPLWHALDQNVSLVIASDTPITWPLDNIGYTFEHKLAWGDDGFEPLVGCTVRLVYWL